MSLHTRPVGEAARTCATPLASVVAGPAVAPGVPAGADRTYWLTPKGTCRLTRCFTGDSRMLLEFLLASLIALTTSSVIHNDVCANQIFVSVGGLPWRARISGLTGSDASSR